MHYGIWIHLLVVTVFLAILADAIRSDVADLRIPNRLCVALVILYPAHVVSSGLPVDWLGALLVCLLVFAAGLAAFAARWMGGGDVKLLAAIALWVGPAAVLPFLAVTALVGGGMALVMVSRVRFRFALVADEAGFIHLRDRLLGRVIPYGVAIAVAGWIVAGPTLVVAGAVQ